MKHTLSLPLFLAILMAAGAALGGQEPQGEHKVQRGYLPEPTFSAHWIRDDGFRDAVDRFLKQETALIRHEMDALRQHSPFKQAGDS